MVNMPRENRTAGLGNGQAAGTLSAELARLGDYLKQQRATFSADEKAAAAFGPSSLPDQVTPVEGAVWTALARVLMNLDEFITRE